MLSEYLSVFDMGEGFYLNCSIPLKNDILPVFVNGNTKALEIDELYELKNIMDNLIFNMEQHNIDGFDIIQEKQETTKHNKRKKKLLKESSCDSQGIIYIMKNCGYYKIGRALSETRLGEYTKLPETPEYIIKENVYNYGSVELSLHEMFKDKRLRDGKCEWFNLTDDDIYKAKEFIKDFIVKTDIQ